MKYATTASNLGSAALAIKSDKYVIFAAMKKNNDDLSEYMEKIFKIDNHIACTASGITADINFMLRKMRGTCMSKNFTLQQPIGIKRLVRNMSESN